MSREIAQRIIYEDTEGDADAAYICTTDVPGAAATHPVWGVVRVDRANSTIRHAGDLNTRNLTAQSLVVVKAYTYDGDPA